MMHVYVHKIHHYNPDSEHIQNLPHALFVISIPSYFAWPTTTNLYKYRSVVFHSTCYLFSLYLKRQRQTKIKIRRFTPRSQSRTRSKPGVQNAIQISNVRSQGPSIWAIAHCLPGCGESGSWIRNGGIRTHTLLWHSQTGCWHAQQHLHCAQLPGAEQLSIFKFWATSFFVFKFWELFTQTLYKSLIRHMFCTYFLLLGGLSSFS